VTAALIVVDVQVGFDDSAWGPRDNPDAEANIARLIASWRRTDRPLILVRHDSVTPGSPLLGGTPGNELRDFVDGPRDLFVTKSVNSAFYGDPDLHQWLQGRDIGELVVCGVTTNHCVETTARMAANLGYKVWFVLDATHTFDRLGPDGRIVPAAELARATAASLHGEFAMVTSTSALLEVFTP
jgi:nicotinamidase-related amidase